MLAKVRSVRGGTCTALGALVCLSLVLPLFLTGTSLSDKIFLDWLTWSRSSNYISNNFAAEDGVRELRGLNFSADGQSSDFAPEDGVRELRGLNVSADGHSSNLAPEDGVRELRGLNFSADGRSSNFAPEDGVRELRGLNISADGHYSYPLKLYVYDLPRKFNLGLLQADNAPDQDLPWAEDRPLPSWPQHTGLRKQHNVEYWLLVDLLDPHVGFEGERAAVRVEHPEEADLFFVPFFSSLSFNKFGSAMRGPLSQKDKALQDEVISILLKSKWYQRSGGKDHIIPVHHPNAFRFAKHRVSSSIFIVADFGRSSPAVSSLRKDVVAPYTHVVPTYKDDNAEDPFEARTTLLYFQGRIKRKDEGIVRTRLANLLHNETGVHFEEGVANGAGLAAATFGMRSSRYCLHPAGDTPSSCRLFDAIVSHCVPVVISDKIELPFEDELIYNEFAYFFSTENAIRPGWLLNQLRSVEKEQWLKKFLKLKEVSHHFEFQHPSKQDDAVNMIWKQLHHKVPGIKLAMHRKKRLRIADWWR